MLTNDIIDEKIRALRAIQEEASRLKDEAEALRNELKAELDSRKADSITTGAYNVFWHCYERGGVDTKKLKADGLYGKYSKTSTVAEFRITDVKVV